MIELVFTLDYEIYGDGTGSLRDLIYDPAERLRDIFRRRGARFVAFVEVAELERIEACGADPAIDLVKRQIRDLDREGFEIGLHLHPQWSNARYELGRWLLDFSEYNLCTLPRPRSAEIVGRGLDYLRNTINRSDFAPSSFRAGNWLLQPTQPVAAVLAENGIRIDSSVFKGGVLHRYNLDYRPAVKNGYYWPFSSDVNAQDPAGALLEIPIHTELVSFWKMPTPKRLGFRNSRGTGQPSLGDKLTRLRDLMRFRYPLKLDFCRMTLGEMTSVMERVIREDQRHPATYRPVVAIGHTKDFIDPQAVDDFLSFLRTRKIPVATFEAIHPTLLQLEENAEAPGRAANAGSVQKFQSGVRLVSDPCLPPANECRPVIHSATVHKPSPAPRLAYVLITPARNEAAFIDKTIECVVAQTMKPVKWVIVSDGSTDGTAEIVERYAAAHTWIELVRLPERRERDFAGKVHAFNAGYARVVGLDFDVVGNLDADITFDEEHFQFLVEKFAENPRLGVAGTPFREGSQQYDYRFTSIEHVSGACQMFRAACFAEIGGYTAIKTGGVDLVAVTTARMKGWLTRTFLEKTCVHHRKVDSANRGVVRAAFHGGWTDYTHGCDPMWEVFRCAYQITRRPFVVGAILCFAGFVGAMTRRTPRVVTPELIRFRKMEHRRRLREFFRRRLQLAGLRLQHGRTMRSAPTASERPGG